MGSKSSRPFKKTVLASVVSAVSIISAQAALAQNQSDDTNSDITEEVVVYGIRQSLSLSVEDKRNASKIVDTINAEDIGKSTDQNIAEALNRVTGVSISTVDGEGSRISVRGANSDQTVITLNGVALGSTGFSQGVDLSAYSSDYLSKIQVIKTPSADDDEGSLGGSVNLTSRKPLDVKEDIRALTVQGRYNDLSEENNHKLSATLSQKFLDDSVGFIVTLTDESNSVRKDQYVASDYNVFGSNIYTDQNGVSYGNQAAIDAESAGSAMDGRTDEFANLTAAPALDNSLWTFGGGDPAYADIVKGLAPGKSGYELHNNKRERSGIDLALQWQINEDTDISFNLNHNKQTFNNRMDGLSVSTTTRPGHIDGITHPALGLSPAFQDRSEFYSGINPELGGLELDADGNPIPGSNRSHRWTDPQQEWRVLDSTTNTWTKFLNRHSSGEIQASGVFQGSCRV